MSLLPSKRICFISHNATRTGAPIVLYQFVKWLKEQEHYSIDMLFLEDGEMVKDFELLGSCKVLPSFYDAGITGTGRRVLSKLYKRDVWLQHKLKYLSGYDLLFFNTVASFKIIPLLPKRLDVTCVAWLHEQPFSIGSWYKEQFTASNLNLFHRIICVSSQTGKYLEEEMGIDPAKVSVVHPFIDVAALSRNLKHAIIDNSSRPFIVGGCGLQDWRKGPDLFLQAARKIKTDYPDAAIQFVWVGGESGLTSGLQYELEKLELQDMVRFVGAQTNIAEWFSGFNVFLLTSREDPFPLVVLEAAAMEKPVICFDGIGDITKLIAAVPENVVNYGDVEEMCKRIWFYYELHGNITHDGGLLKEKVMYFDKEETALKLFAAISQFLQ